MKTLKTLRTLVEEIKVYNLDSDEELDLDALANLDLDELLGFSGDDPDEENDGEFGELNFNDEIGSMSLDDYELDPDSEFAFSGDSDFDSSDDFSFDVDSETEGEDDVGSMSLDDYELDPDADFEDAPEGFEGDEFEDGEFGEDEEEDSDFQGDIRTVRGANLVFKRKTEDGNFEELWIYNVGKDIKHETKVRRAILAGTDINPSTQESEDGEQRATTTTAGNVQFLHITGLPQ